MTTARDIMHTGAQCIGEDQTLMEAAQMMRDLGVGSLPICGNDKKFHRIITDRDIVIKAVAEGKDLWRAPPASSRRATSPMSTLTPTWTPSSRRWAANRSSECPSSTTTSSWA